MIPAGRKGFQWERIVHLISGVLGSSSLNLRNQTPRILLRNKLQVIQHHGEAATDSANQRYNYAHAVKEGVNLNGRNIRIVTEELQITSIRDYLEEGSYAGTRAS